jgi:hypothetical protein
MTRRRLVLVVLGVVIASAIATGGWGLVGGGNKTCLVLAIGGNKLCDQDAAAWCRATDSIRKLNQTDTTVAQTQADCDELEAKYPG